MNKFIEGTSKTLKKAGMVDITYDNINLFCGTLLPFSSIRPFQKEKIRYYGITGVVAALIYSSFDKMYPIDITYIKEEILEE
jgi:hypothetical protein